MTTTTPSPAPSPAPANTGGRVDRPVSLVRVIASEWLKFSTVRSTPGVLVAAVALIPILPVLFELVLPSWGTPVAAYLPTGAGASFSTSLRMPNSLPPWVGLGVMVAWVAFGLVVASVMLRRRDA